MMRSKARVGPFRSKTLIGAIRSPSWMASSAHGTYDPGTAPPMSAQWARLMANAASRPPANTGRIAFTSGRWLPPTSGRFRYHTSPSRSSRRGTRRRNSFTVKAITPRWMGMSRPWAISRPRASVSALDRSPASLRSGERAERMMMTLISSAIA